MYSSIFSSCQSCFFNCFSICRVWVRHSRCVLSAGSKFHQSYAFHNHICGSGTRLYACPIFHRLIYQPVFFTIPSTSMLACPTQRFIGELSNFVGYTCGSIDLQFVRPRPPQARYKPLPVLDYNLYAGCCPAIVSATKTPSSSALCASIGPTITSQ